MKRILFFAVILFNLNSIAQVSMGVTGFNSPANDTVIAGSTETYSVWIKNYGPGNFNDMVYLSSGIRDSSSVIADTLSTFNTGSLVINAGDSVSVDLTTTYNITPTGYRYGIDVIVIWPYAQNAIVVDSLEFVVYILDPTGTKELDVNQLIRLYPNPAVNEVSIDNSGGTAVKSINIYDLSGRLLISNRDQTTINTECLSPGMYCVEIILSNNKHYKLNIIRQK
jgi:hypothetical protein